MAPSLTETASDIADKINVKSLSLGSSDVKEESPAVKEDAPSAKEEAPAVQAPSKWQPKEPLKLSGALNHFQSFDVTPVIGREFVGVNLAKWLRAPNSDELLRDLAITSTSALDFSNLTNMSSLPTRSRLLQKARRRHQRSPKETCPASWRTLRQTLHIQATHSPSF